MTWEHLRKLRQNIHLAVISLSDSDAVETPDLFPDWEVDKAYAQGDRFQYEGELYKVIQAHTSQADWTPDTATSLYEKVAKPGQGDTPDNPIPYTGNMALENGKYYSEDGVVYICFRDTGVAVYNALRDLVEIYVRVYQGG